MLHRVLITSRTLVVLRPAVCSEVSYPHCPELRDQTQEAMNWQSPFSSHPSPFSAFSPKVSSTTLDSTSSTDSSPEQKLLGNSTTTSPSSGDSDVPMSRTHQYKKVTKPLLERKRRARINKCLDELKDIMTVALQAEGENVSKLEKADILELTVRHLHKLTQGRRLFVRNPLEDIQKFQQGYSSCAQEAATFLLSVPEVDVRVSQRLLSHLSTTASAAIAANIPPLSLNLPLQHPPQTSRHRQFSPPVSPPTSSPPFSASSFNPSLSTPSPPAPQIKTESQRSPPPPPTINLQFSIRRQTPEPLTERTQNEKAMPIKPAAIRLNPSSRSSDSSGEGMWRPYNPN